MQEFPSVAPSHGGPVSPNANKENARELSHDPEAQAELLGECDGGKNAPASRLGFVSSNAEPRGAFLLPPSPASPEGGMDTALASSEERNSQKSPFDIARSLIASSLAVQRLAEVAAGKGPLNPKKKRAEEERLSEEDSAHRQQQDEQASVCDANGEAGSLREATKKAAVSAEASPRQAAAASWSSLSVRAPDDETPSGTGAKRTSREFGSREESSAVSSSARPGRASLCADSAVSSPLLLVSPQREDAVASPSSAADDARREDSSSPLLQAQNKGRPSSEDASRGGARKSAASEERQRGEREGGTEERQKRSSLPQRGGGRLPPAEAARRYLRELYFEDSKRKPRNQAVPPLPSTASSSQTVGEREGEARLAREEQQKALAAAAAEEVASRIPRPSPLVARSQDASAGFEKPRGEPPPRADCFTEGTGTLPSADSLNLRSLRQSCYAATAGAVFETFTSLPPPSVAEHGGGGRSKTASLPTARESKEPSSFSAQPRQRGSSDSALKSALAAGTAAKTLNFAKENKGPPEQTPAAAESQPPPKKRRASASSGQEERENPSTRILDNGLVGRRAFSTLDFEVEEKALQDEAFAASSSALRQQPSRVLAASSTTNAPSRTSREPPPLSPRNSSPPTPSLRLSEHQQRASSLGAGTGGLSLDACKTTAFTTQLAARREPALVELAEDKSAGVQQTPASRRSPKGPPCNPSSSTTLVSLSVLPGSETLSSQTRPEEDARPLPSPATLPAAPPPSVVCSPRRFSPTTSPPQQTRPAAAASCSSSSCSSWPKPRQLSPSPSRISAAASEAEGIPEELSSPQKTPRHSCCYSSVLPSAADRPRRPSAPSQGAPSPEGAACLSPGRSQSLASDAARAGAALGGRRTRLGPSGDSSLQRDCLHSSRESRLSEEERVAGGANRLSALNKTTTPRDSLCFPVPVRRRSSVTATVHTPQGQREAVALRWEESGFSASNQQSHLRSAAFVDGGCFRVLSKSGDASGEEVVVSSSFQNAVRVLETAAETRTETTGVFGQHQEKRPLPRTAAAVASKARFEAEGTEGREAKAASSRAGVEGCSSHPSWGSGLAAAFKRRLAATSRRVAAKLKRAAARRVGRLRRSASDWLAAKASAFLLAATSPLDAADLSSLSEALPPGFTQLPNFALALLGACEVRRGEESFFIGRRLLDEKRVSSVEAQEAISELRAERAPPSPRVESVVIQLAAPAVVEGIALVAVCDQETPSFDRQTSEPLLFVEAVCAKPAFDGALDLEAGAAGVWTLSARGERVRTSGVVGDGGGKCLLFSMAPESPQRRREFSRRSRRSSCAAPGSDSGWRDESSSFRFLRGRDLPRLSGLASAARVLCAGRSPPFQASLKSAAVAANEEDSLASASLPFAASGRPSAEWRKGAARAFRQGRCCVSLRREASAFCAGARPSLLRRVFENRPKEEEQRANPGVEAEEWILRLSERCCLRKAEFWSAVYGGGNRSSNGVPSGRRVQIFGLDETPELQGLSLRQLQRFFQSRACEEELGWQLLVEACLPEKFPDGVQVVVPWEQGDSLALHAPPPVLFLKVRISCEDESAAAGEDDPGTSDASSVLRRAAFWGLPLGRIP